MDDTRNVTARSARVLESAENSGRPLINAGVVERLEDGMVILSPASGAVRRRILHVNSYGGRFIWERIKGGLLPSHQLLGCLQLVRDGYEVALAEPLQHFNLYRKPFPHDLKLLKRALSWLGKDGILFCGHTILYWLPLLRSVGIVKCPIVSLLYARDDLSWAQLHDCIISLTPAGAAHARKIAPKAKVAALGWGVDLSFFPRRSYEPEFFLSCGIAGRDFRTLSTAARIHALPMQVICPGLLPGLEWPDHVTVIDGGRGWLTDRTKTLTPRDIADDYLPRSAAVLIITGRDDEERGACGFTNLMEAMAAERPVILTRTGALLTEIDIEKEGFGLYVPPEDPEAVAKAMKSLADDPQLAESMGSAARKLCESHYNIERYANQLHELFESL